MILQADYSARYSYPKIPLNAAREGGAVVILGDSGVMNQDIIDLYGRVPVGTPILVK